MTDADVTSWAGLTPPYSTIVVDPPWHYAKTNADAPRFVDSNNVLRSSGIHASGTAGKGNPPRMPWHGTTWFTWPHTSGHSVKPDAFGDLVESWCPGPYVELFARAPRLGWDSWGYGYETRSA